MESIDHSEHIYIHNAGLVLLHPFLHTCFERLDYLKNGLFINKEAADRAVHLLQYIATGTGQNPQDHLALALNKIVCGISLSVSLSSGVELTEQEKTTALQLEKAILSNWPEMKQTSVTGFRETFLQRAGHIVLKEDHWALKVERKSYDVLLQTLPWSFAAIKTTWMNRTLNTEWI